MVRYVGRVGDDRVERGNRVVRRLSREEIPQEELLSLTGGWEVRLQVFRERSRIDVTPAQLRDRVWGAKRSKPIARRVEESARAETRLKDNVLGRLNRPVAQHVCQAARSVVCT